MTPPKVGQVSEGIPHAYKSVETFASAVFLHAFMQSQPISFLDNWKERIVFCYQNCSDLLWEKIVLVIEKNFWNSRLQAKNLQKFWDH